MSVCVPVHARVTRLFCSPTPYSRLLPRKSSSSCPSPSPLRREPTQSPGLTPQTLADVIANLTTYDASLFLRQFWEVQSDVYELGAGWIFWSIKHEL